MRRVSVLLAAFGLVVSFAAPPSVAAARPVEYLALGDSLAFGYSPFANPTNPDNFVGYPEMLAPMLRDSLTNASCPGETSSHFISLSGADHGCGDWRTTYHLPLHTSYSTSQLAFMDAFLQAHPKTALITIDMGANDLGALRDSCLASPDWMACVIAGMPGMLATYSANLDTIYRHIRVVDGYRHKLVALAFYSPNYADPAITWAVSQVNAVLVDRTLAWGGIVADGFGAFALAATPYGGDTCAAGLRIVNLAPPPACDDHPSAAGRDLLALTIARTVRFD